MPRTVHAFLPATLLLAAAHAQVVRAESLTTWSNPGSPPAWSRNVPNAGSTYGVVDQLNSDTIVLYTSAPLTLGPGTYVASSRLMKFLDQTGVAPFTFTATVTGSLPQSTILPAAAQLTDTWVQTTELVFKVTAPNTQVIFGLDNLDGNVTKQNYYFDSFVVGRVDLGPVLHYESLGWRWGHAWGAPHYTSHVPETTSAFGEVEQLNNVWWFEWGYPTRDFVLQPGIYTANIRLKKMGSIANAQPLDLTVDIGGAQSTSTITVAQQQPVDTWLYTPDLVFTVTAPSTLVKFKFHNILSTYKALYQFDSFAIRQGSFTVQGQSCSSSLGPVTLLGEPPQLGEVQTIRVQNIPGLGVLTYGTQPLSLDLTGAGMPGCFLYNSIALVLALNGAGGTASAALTVPNDPSLRGGVIYNQAVCYDPGANAAGFVTSHGGISRISP